jgi:transposase-like protein
LPTRPSGQKEGVLVVWGYTAEGKRVLLAVRLGQRESHEDWLDLGRDLTRRGLRPPWLVVSDGAPGLIKAIQELWPESDRGRCAVHKLRNIIAKLPKRAGLHDPVKAAYWAALDEATDPADAERRLRALVAELERPYPSAAACLAEDLPALVYPSEVLPTPAQAVPVVESVGAFVGGGEATDESDRPFSGRNELFEYVLGRT